MHKLISLTLAAAALLALTGQSPAQESSARSWGLSEEQLAPLSGTVVDPLCELAGDCPEDCGGGDRPLGIRTDDGRLVLAAKNGQPLFTGAGQDLAPYCSQKVEVDGLFTGHGGNAIYQVQLIRPFDATGFAPANRWTEAWAERYPEHADGDGPWYRRDPRVLSRIERDGYLGLGKAIDEAFIEEWF